MPTPKCDPKLLQEALNLVEQWGSEHLALRAEATKIPEGTLRNRVKQARLLGMTPTVRKDAPRIYTRQRLGRMHCVIPDVQSKPGVRNDHMTWVGNYIAETKPDVIVNIGDFWDMESLSIYDKGKLPFEGRRYVNCVKAGRVAMEKLLKPIDDYNRTAKKGEKYHPEMHFTMGNHEHRIVRLADNNPEYEGKFSLDDLGVAEYGWKVHDFLKIIKIDGVEYCHYFTSGVMGRPVSSAATLLRERQCSATMGHVQHADCAMHKKTQQRALFAATCYLHDEKYLGEQGNGQRRQIIMKHEVNEGRYDLMEVSLAFLEKAYS
jgi:hypothetical protein